MAEKKIDTVYTSDNYPNDWVQAGCAVRYKYHFRRGPLQMRAAGNVFNLGFTGYYQVIGSTRACVNGAVISPWTPPCNCGFNEGERKVNITFSNLVNITPDYKLKLSVKRLEPQALDKCTVCFWGQDITKEVMMGLKANLDEAKGAIEKKYGVIDLRQRFQLIWDKLSEVYNVYELGWLQINPKKLRLNSLMARNDSLNINLGISAHPVIGFEKQTGESISQNIVFKKSFAYSDFVNDYNAFKGNAYGLANTLRQTAILKPSIRNKKLKNLFYTGQLTVPGPGVPPAIISGEVVAKYVIDQFR